MQNVRGNALGGITTQMLGSLHADLHLKYCAKAVLSSTRLRDAYYSTLVQWYKGGGATIHLLNCTRACDKPHDTQLSFKMKFTRLWRMHMCTVNVHLMLSLSRFFLLCACPALRLSVGGMQTPLVFAKAARADLQSV